MNCFHLSDHSFELGELIVPMEGGYTSLPESTALEAVLEMFRPNNKLSRIDSIFVSPNIPKSDLGAKGIGTCFICLVPDEAMEQKSDLHWLSELDLGFEELDQLLSEYSLDELQHFAEGYWSGKERYLGKAQWEVRWHTATIIGSTLSPI